MVTIQGCGSFHLDHAWWSDQAQHAQTASKDFSMVGVIYKLQLWPWLKAM